MNTNELAWFEVDLAVPPCQFGLGAGETLESVDRSCQSGRVSASWQHETQRCGCGGVHGRHEQPEKWRECLREITDSVADAGARKDGEPSEEPVSKCVY
jgi:hypothetical protein